jgi:dinuclear metal center YbgI/SA1388 family protein
MGIRHVVDAMRRWAPEAWAEEWDNVGWLVRRQVPDNGPLKVVVSLDPVDPEWAAAEGFRLNVSHHPTMFRPLRRVDDATWAARAWAAGLDLYAAHTNLDSAPGGVNDALAEMLGLENIRPLIPSDRARLVKFVTYVPPENVEAVRAACAHAGAGAIGNYDECSFSWPGTGTFRPLPGANPYTATKMGELERASEVRLEMIVPAHLRDAVVSAARSAHPYEEMAFDVIPLANADPRVGLGRVGTLSEPVSLEDFCARVSERLGTDCLSLAGSAREIRTVAVMGGSGGKYWPAANAAGADVYLTGEAGHHDALDASEAGLALLDAGHFATERPVLPCIKAYLEHSVPGLAVTVAAESDPLRRV